MREAPAKVDDLDRRVAELEQKLTGPWPPDVCRLCGERAARLDYSGEEKGIVRERWECTASVTGNFTMRRIKRTGPDLWSATTTTYNVETARYLGNSHFSYWASR